MLLFDFCNIKKWSPEVILDLHKKYAIGHDPTGEPDNINHLSICQTVHDTGHKYILVEDQTSRFLQQHIPETFIIPSQPQFRSLYSYLLKSQMKYRGLLRRCSRNGLGIDFIGFLNDVLRNASERPTFFTGYERSKNRRKKEVANWNPILRFIEATPVIEDAIDQEIINTFLAHQGEIFSRVRKCPHCRRYFLAERSKKRKFCDDQCKVDYNNRSKTETGYSAKFQKDHQVKGIYVKHGRKNSPHPQK